MKNFATLLQREWLQHRTGWLVTVAVPIAIALVVLAAGQMTIDIDGHDAELQFDAMPPAVLAIGAIAAMTAATLALAWFVALFQASGLARRDQQDRSIEFWLSLPTGHLASVLAPPVTHLVLFPIAALAIGVVGGHFVALAFVVKAEGFAAWLTLPWPSLLAATGALAVRLALGVVLATVWLSPLILLAMTASAWLKRWGLPTLVASLVILGNLLDKLYGNPVIPDTLTALLVRAGRSLLGAERTNVQVKSAGDVVDLLGNVPVWAAADAARAFGMLADPLLVLVLAIGGACIALLVARRRRGA